MFNLDTLVWTQLNTTQAPGTSNLHRFGHSLWNVGPQLLLFGGSIVDRGLLSFDYSALRWANVESPQPMSDRPMTRLGQRSAFSTNTSIIMFSGETVSTRSCYALDVWELNFTNNLWSPLSQALFPWDSINQRWADDIYGPDSRAFHQFVALPDSTSFIMFGGQDAIGFKGNLWEFSSESRCFTRRVDRLATLVGPGSRYGHTALVYERKLYMFGGTTDGFGGNDDIWAFDYQSAGFGKPFTCGSTSPVSFFVIGIIFLAAWFILLGLWFVLRSKSADSALPPVSSEQLRPSWMKPNAYFVPKTNRDFALVFNGREERSSTKLSPLSDSTSSYSSSSSSVDEDYDSGGSESENLFFRLPDESLVRIMTFLNGPDLAAAVVVDHRFQRLSNDSAVWKRIVADYWEETPMFADLRARVRNFSYKDFFLHGAKRFARSKREGNLRSAVHAIHSTSPFYVAIFLVALQAFLVGLKLDGVSPLSVASWGLLFVPLLVLAVCGLIICIAATTIRLKYRIGHAILSGLSQSMQVTVKTVSRPLRLIFIWLAALAFVFTPTLLSLKLDWKLSVSWWIVMLPVFILLIALAIVPIRLVFSRKHSFIWFAGGGPLFLFGTLLAVVAKLDAGLEIEWCILFVPWWLSEGAQGPLKRTVSSPYLVGCSLHFAGFSWHVSLCKQGYSWLDHVGVLCGVYYVHDRY